MKDISKGYIALYRQFLDWEWYDDANTMRLFIHCLLLANYTDKKWRGKVIKRGQFITSQPKLAHSLKLSIMQIRNSLTKLKSTGEITVYTTADYSVITVKNYDFYQDNNSLDNSLTFQKQQSSNSLTTTTNKDNKEISNNISLSINNESKKITKEEREILKNYLLRQKRKPDNPDAYLKTLIQNGDWIGIVEKERRRLQAREEKRKEKEAKPEIEREDAETVKRAMEAAHDFIFKRGVNR